MLRPLHASLQFNMSVIAWRKLAIAGVAGLACGKGYVWMRQYPDTVQPILYCSALSGATGVLLGFGVAAYRDLPSHVYALSTGTNFAVVTAAFLGIRHVVLKSLVDKQGSSAHSVMLTLQQAEFVSSAAGGGASVTMATILSRRGVRSTLWSGCVGVALGLLTQLLYNQFESWRKRKGMEMHYPELSEKRPGSEWSLAKFEARFMGFWHQRSRAIQMDMDITLLSETIKDEKKKIQYLDQLLKEKGVKPVVRGNIETVEKRTITNINDDSLDSTNNSEVQLPETR